MRTSTFSPFPEGITTPPILRKLILITCVASLGLPFLDVLIGALFKITGLQGIFCVSWMTFSEFFLWQPLTHLFIMQPYGGIHLDLIITLFFRMYILWFIGGFIIRLYGTGSFLWLYVGSGVLSALAFLTGLVLTGNNLFLFGNTASLLSLFVLWAMMNADGYVFLFFVIPIRTKWLLAGVTALVILLNLSDNNIPWLLSSTTGLIFGYLYATMRWDLKSPFPQTHQIDEKLSYWGTSLIQVFQNVKNLQIFNRESDAAFIDRMLEKISKKGPNSLSWWEKRKLDRLTK